eukprot:COSAG02_NODE_32792_length_510_cov_1.574209_1_plen_47_part_10
MSEARAIPLPVDGSIYDSPLNLPHACFQLFNKLDAWLPGWRTVAHKL